MNADCEVAEILQRFYKCSLRDGGLLRILVTRFTDLVPELSVTSCIGSRHAAFRSCGTDRGDDKDSH